MIVPQSQSVVAVVSVVSCLLLLVLPSSLSSAYRLDRVRNDPMLYKGFDLGHADTDRQKHGEWRRSLPILVSLLRHFYNWDQKSADLDESPRYQPDPSSSQTLRSRQKQALLEMLASLSDISHSLDDVDTEKVILDDKSLEITSRESDENEVPADDSLMTSKLKRGHVYGAVPPLHELCRMMGVRPCTIK